MGRKAQIIVCLAGWVCACVLVVILIARPAPPRGIVLRDIRQDTALDPLPLAATNAPLLLLQAVNEYRTDPGWIAASNDRIYAGLADRSWSAAYTATAYRHTLSLLAGGGIGAQYTYTLAGRYPIGGMVLYAGGLKVFASAGFQW